MVGQTKSLAELGLTAQAGRKADVTGLAVVGPYLYSTLNFAGKIYRTHRVTGATELFLEGLDSPRDVACLPMKLSPR